MWPGQAHLYHESYSVHPINFRTLLWAIYSHVALSVTFHPTSPPPPNFNLFWFNLASSTSNIFKSTKLTIFFGQNFTLKSCDMSKIGQVWGQSTNYFPIELNVNLIVPSYFIMFVKVKPFPIWKFNPKAHEKPKRVYRLRFIFSVISALYDTSKVSQKISLLIFGPPLLPVLPTSFLHFQLKTSDHYFFGHW